MSTFCNGTFTGYSFIIYFLKTKGLKMNVLYQTPMLYLPLKREGAILIIFEKLLL